MAKGAARTKKEQSVKEKTMTKQLFFALGDQLAQDISSAVSDALNKTFSITVTPDRYVLGKGSVNLSGDVSGIVGLSQDKLEGTLTLCFPMQSVKKLIPRILGDDITITDDVVVDAVGEITNMIFGRLKTELNERGHHLRFGLPSVIRGEGHFINQLHQGHYMMMPFTMENEPFQLHLAIHNHHDQ
jgi:CheY-specific phosphatase CheX